MPVSSALDIMDALSAVLQIISALFAGGIIGGIFGFSVASHNDVLRGVRPHTESRLIHFLARPTSEFSLFEGALLFVIILVWLVIFCALCALPAIVYSRTSNNGLITVEIVYTIFVLAGLLGRKFGGHVWKVKF